jgi:hypothetical protein
MGAEKVWPADGPTPIPASTGLGEPDAPDPPLGLASANGRHAPVARKGER